MLPNTKFKHLNLKIPPLSTYYKVTFFMSRKNPTCFKYSIQLASNYVSYSGNPYDHE